MYVNMECILLQEIFAGGILENFMFAYLDWDFERVLWNNATTYQTGNSAVGL